MFTRPLNPLPLRLTARLLYKTSERLESSFDDPGIDACGITAIQSGTGANREVVDMLLEALEENDIRAGKIVGPDGRPISDGAGITLRTDNDANGRGMQEYLHQMTGRGDRVPVGHGENIHGGLLFIDRSMARDMGDIRDRVEQALRYHGLRMLGFKPANVDPEAISPVSRHVMPEIHQLTYARGQNQETELQQKVFEARLQIQRELGDGVYIVSLQPGTMTFKGMIRGEEFGRFYLDLERPDVITDAGLTHTRFSTNVLGNWKIAQGFDMLVHNGEVNSIRKILKVLQNLERMYRLDGSNIMKNASDSANLDRTLQFLRGKMGLSLEEAVRYLIHPPLDEIKRMPEEIQNYFAAVSRVMGSLKAIGPIALLGMDRNKIVAALDNMGLRPLRIVQRKDGLIVIGSEVGMPHIPLEDVQKYGRVRPGELNVVHRDGSYENNGDVNRRIIQDTKLPYDKLANRKIVTLGSADKDPAQVEAARKNMETVAETFARRANLFGLNRERVQRIRDSIEAGSDPIEGMGSDLAMAVFSPEPNSLGRYIQADYSQVSNPSLDYVREKGPFTTEILLGARPKKNRDNSYETQTQYLLADPLLDEDQMAAIYATPESENPKQVTISTTYQSQSVEACLAKIEEIKNEVILKASNGSHAIIVLSDRDATGDGDGYIPPALLVAYLSKELDKEGLSSGVSLVVDTGEVLDQHEFNILVACGAKGVHPRLVYEMIDNEEVRPKPSHLREKNRSATFTKEEMKEQVRKSFKNTLLRYMAKLGITDIDAYRGSQQFSTLGLSSEFVHQYFNTEVPTNGGGLGLEKILADQWRRCDATDKKVRTAQERHGYQKQIWKALHEAGGNVVKNPEDIYELQQIDGLSDTEVAERAREIAGTEKALWDAYRAEIKKEGILNLRDTFKLKEASAPVPLEEVTPTAEIIKHIIRGAGISLGSINDAAHRALHLLFNHYDSYANSGEGGVPKNRRPGEKYEAAHARSIQVASGRFGVDIEYLANPQVREIEIKIGQGAKPGVGGHLPGKKAFHFVAEIRGVSLGQELISPPTNHDIYSIEDLEGLIQRLGACNPAAKIGVKITSGSNVGTIAAGCVKAGADAKVQISGGAGGHSHRQIQHRSTDRIRCSRGPQHPYPTGT